MSIKESRPYILEIRLESMRRDSVAQIESSNPFQSFAIGDKFYHNMFDTAAWDPLPKKGEVFVIIDKAHIVDPSDETCMHSVIICLSPRAVNPGSSSPGTL